MEQENHLSLNTERTDLNQDSFQFDILIVCLAHHVNQTITCLHNL